MKIYGYVRVSTREQNEAWQLIAMEEFGVASENIYLEKQSGKDFDRPKYKILLGRLHKNDVLVVKSIDRLGRNYDDTSQSGTPSSRNTKPQAGVRRSKAR